MGKITAWQCNKTKIVFTDLDDFKRHLCAKRIKGVRQARKHEREAQQDAILQVLYRSVTTDDILNWLHKPANAALLLDRANWTARKSRNKICPKPKYTFEFSHLRIDWVSTSHCAPFGEKISGWYDQEKVYELALRGAIYITVNNASECPDHPTSELLNNTGINTGTGGGGSGKYNYDVVLFAKDFPLIFARMVEESQVDQIYHNEITHLLSSALSSEG